MTLFKRHAYHLVDHSPWPLFSSLASLGLVSGLVEWFVFQEMNLFILSLLVLGFNSFSWWGDVSKEASALGLHTLLVEVGLRWGVGLFIVSEVFFFVSFFWTYFHAGLAPSGELGLVWPPVGLSFFDPFGVPLLNTTILLSSGVSVTWAHHALLWGSHREGCAGLLWTVVLGAYFTAIQYLEYQEASFTFSDSVFGSVFFMATGFHGIHVLVGSAFLAKTYLRVREGLMSPLHHLGFEAAAWYWHFVDVVWILLYLWVYVWSHI